MTTTRPQSTRAPRVAGEPEAVHHLRLGIAQMANLLAPTLGPLGTPVFCEGTQRTKVEWLDDAATIARRITSLGNPKLDVGAMLMRNVIWRVEQRAGDGGATAAVLFHDLFERGLRQLSAGANAMLLARGVRLGLDAAVQALAAQAHMGVDESRLAAVARAVTRDADLAAILGEMSYLLGPDAPVDIETFVAPYLQRSYLTGAVYAARIASSHLYTDRERKRAIHAGPAVALVDHRITQAEEAIALMRGAIENGRTSLVMVAPEVSGPALNVLVANHAQPADKRKLAVLIVTLTQVGDDRTWALYDLSLLTGATVLGSQAERTARTALPSDLGAAQRVEFAADRLSVVTDPHRRTAVQNEIAALRTRLDQLALDDADRPALTRRLAALNGGVGVLKVGAHARLAMELRRTQAERTLKVLSAVQRGGVVAGAGAALLHCAPAVRQAAAASSEADEVRLGMRILADALASPLHRLLINAGVEPPSVVEAQIAEAGAPATYDTNVRRVVDAHAAGVLDATDVLATVLQSAVSGAMMALTTGAIVYHRNPEQSFEP